MVNLTVQLLRSKFPIFLFAVALVPLSVLVEVEATGTGATDLAPSRVPVLGPLAPGLDPHLRRATDAGVVLQATHLAATVTVIRTVEEEDTVVVALLEGSVTITIALHVLVRVLVPRFVVAERGRFLPGDARLATPEEDMAVGEGRGVTLCVRVDHVRGHTLGRSRGLAPGHIRVIQGIRKAGAVVGPSAEEGELGAGAEPEMTFETAGQGRRGSRFSFSNQLFFKMFLVFNILFKMLALPQYHLCKRFNLIMLRIKIRISGLS